MAPDEWHHRTQAALHWLLRSIAVTGNKGSAHSWSPLGGWRKAYPETTGYIIENMIDYGHFLKDPRLLEAGHNCADWLCSLQLPNGAFPGLLVGHTQPSVFNTGQILFGLTKVIEDGSHNPLHLKALERAVEWLVSIIEKDGSWQQGAYVQNYVPSYYTRAVWGVLRANQILQRIDIESIMRYSINYYAQRIQSNGAVEDWGFWPNRPAFTHTIAYTLEGFAETAILLKDDALLLKTQFIADELAKVYATHGRAAGSYDTDWQGDYSFICPTGNAQLGSFYFKMAHFTGNTAYTSIGLRFLAEILPFQVMQPPFYLQSAKGAIPGSVPFWGAYQRFRYPNWGTKFLLDALWHLKPV